MRDTKERILRAAVRLFARDGYEAASVAAITGELGITKGALYKHYGSKREILDRIVERMERRDLERAREFGVPEEVLGEATEDSYRAATRDDIRAFTLAQFRYWTEDELASSFRKMLTLEQYRNPEMATLMDQYLTGGVIGYLQDLFTATAGFGDGDGADMRVLALQFFAPVHMMMGVADSMDDKTEAVRLVEAHMDLFFRRAKTKQPDHKEGTT